MEKERVRAVIVRGDEISLIKRVKEHETYWVLPGGGVEEGESKEEALRRECLEELGLKIEVSELILQKQIEGAVTAGQMEYFYVGRVIGGKIGTGTGPEFQEKNRYEGSHEIVSVPLDKLPNLDLRPKEVKEVILGKF